MLDEYSQSFGSSIKKFEEMLKTNFTFFFDAQEIEYIAQHYIDFGKMNLARKAIKIGNKQHPCNINILLLKSFVRVVFHLAEFQLFFALDLEQLQKLIQLL